MNIEFLLKIGGIYNILCALLHLAFPKILKWDEILKQLFNEQRPFIEQPLKIMNWCLFIFWIILAYIPLVHTSELLNTGLGRTLLSSIVIFWSIRIFILQPAYIGVKDPISWKMIGFFLVGLLLFAIPLLKSI